MAFTYEQALALGLPFNRRIEELGGYDPSQYQVTTTPYTPEPTLEEQHRRDIRRAEEKETATREAGIGILEGMVPTLRSSRAAGLRDIDQSRARISAMFDPVRSQFQQLFDQPTIDAEQEGGLRDVIRSQFARSLERGQEDILNKLAARGLGTSSIMAREQLRNLGETTASRVGAENQLATAIAQLNRQGQESAARGLAGLALGEGQLEAGFSGRELGARGLFDQLLTGIRGQEAAIKSGQEYTIPDIFGAYGVQTSQDLLDLMRQQYEYEQSPEALGRTILETILGYSLPTLLGA
jgi:hypothetical protein